MALQHFSHEHPLVLITRLVRNDDEEKDQQSIICYGCQQPILFSTTTSSDNNSPDYCYYYSCNTCTYRLHKKCAELPHGVKHPKHPQHPLTLLAHPPRYYLNCTCNVCKKREWKWFIYHCAKCKFNAHVTCTPLEERPNKHKFHDHPLTFTQRPAYFFCDACGTEGEDLSYRCTNTSCQFWIHDTCASSPNSIKRNDHRHPLHLTYSIPYSKRKFDHDCYICNKAVYPNYWVYYCALCTYFAHLKCGISEESSSALSDTISIQNSDRDLVCVPVPGLMNMMTQFSIDTSLIYNKKKRIACPNGHFGALVYDDIYLENEMKKKKREILCNVCAQPISFSSPFTNCAKCSFIAHTRCTLLKSRILHPSHPQHPLTLAHMSTFGIHRCKICGDFTNGYFFYCSKTCENFRIDVVCATTFLPNKIKHDAHAHPLTLQTVVSTPDYLQYCKACVEVVDYGLKYACDSAMNCDYRLHTNCAMLPGTLEHDWDKHHMSLIYPPFDHPEDYFCETCEEDIHPTHWLYHCSKCDHSFHTNCAHPHDKWSKVTFGITYKFMDHEHDLTFVRKTKKSRPCENCSKCYRDDPFLDCASCSYQMCYICGSKAGKRIE